ncbi:MAG: hypothetical protein K0R28_1185 [Paenibacillus sp.]|uniref:hypothetical protein n=1 Tax=Paenibacillus mesophilus TaxID=2582849 RepID=UPI00110ED1DE|nr:hypothetical protein [Paenibacillus mesophilus]MDF2714260.1 hypothetical protein [Paenibacillus sp.]TMV45788.1 hypothetical protein FE783_28040 [Paenibacillus mesophilus]
MTTKQLALKQESVKDGNRLASFMTVAAWIALAIGLLTCLFEVSDFSDRNLGLMVGIGFLVGSVQIYMIGAAIRLFHHNKAKQSE